MFPYMCGFPFDSFQLSECDLISPSLPWLIKVRLLEWPQNLLVEMVYIDFSKFLAIWVKPEFPETLSDRSRSQVIIFSDIKGRFPAFVRQKNKINLICKLKESFKR